LPRILAKYSGEVDSNLEHYLTLPGNLGEIVVIVRAGDTAPGRLSVTVVPGVREVDVPYASIDGPPPRSWAFAGAAARNAAAAAIKHKIRATREAGSISGNAASVTNLND
jgi:hypothetical protein